MPLIPLLPSLRIRPQSFRGGLESHERTGIVVEIGSMVWIIGVAVSRSCRKASRALAEACGQTIAKRQQISAAAAVCLGIAVNDKQRAITRWQDFGDLKQQAKAWLHFQVKTARGACLPHRQRGNNMP
jgi:hypothetical protein